MSGSFPFQVVRAADYEAMSRAAADAFFNRLRRKRNLLVVLATGASPARTYQLIAERGRSEPELFTELRLMKLDEWGGLDPDDPATCEVAIRTALVDPLKLRSDQLFGWQSDPADTVVECARISKWLGENGPVDLCLLGLGLNGHLGFNEPAEFLEPGPHRAELSTESKQHSMLRVARRQSRFGLTLGIRDILRCREAWLLVSGEAKRAQLKRVLEPQVAPQCPASFLWLHDALTVFCDEAALPS